MNRFARTFSALALATAASTALAAPPAKLQHAVMTDAEMDNVTAGTLTIVLQDSFNDWNIDFGGTSGVPGNGHAKGFDHGKGNPHQNGGTTNGVGTPGNNTMLFQVNIIANVNTAIAGGDATAGQSVGTTTFTTSLR